VVAVLIAGAAWVWATRVVAPENPFLISSGDAFGYFLPAHEYEARRLAGGSFPLWNPYQGAGVPFLATLQPGALHPARLLALATAPATAMGWSAFAHALLALLGTHALCRRLGASVAAAALGGVVFATAFALPWLGATTMLEAAAWLPLLVLGVVAILDGGGWGWTLVLGAAGAMPVLAGGYQATLYTAYGLGWVALAAALDGWVRGRPPSPRAVGRLVVAGLLAVATAAPQLLTTLAWSGEASRQTRLLSDVQMMTLMLEGARSHRLRTFFVRQSPSDLCHLSIPVVGLVVVGMLSRRPLGLALGLGAILTGLVTLVHPDSFFFPLYEAIPGFGMFRFPTRILFVTALFAAVTAALGLTAIGRLPALATPWRRHAVEALALAAVVALLVLPYRNAAQLPWTAGADTDALREHFLPGHHPPPEYRAWVPAPLALRGGAFAREGMREGVRVLQDYEPLSSRRLGAFLSAVIDRPPPAGDAATSFTGAVPDDRPLVHPSLLDLASVRTIMLDARAVPAPLPSGWTRVATHAGLATFRNDGALPRAYVVRHARFRPDETAALAALIAPGFDGRSEVVLVGAPATDDERALAAASRAPAAPARIAVDDPERVVVDVGGAPPGVLVLTDAFAPGWEAAVDGVPRRLWQANHLGRGVLLAPGDRRVEFRYRAPGVALAAGAWSGVLAAAAWRRRRTSRAGADHST
jgi:hypothetical protein